LALTSKTSGGGSVVIVRLRTKATEFSLGFLLSLKFFIVGKNFWENIKITGVLQNFPRKLSGEFKNSGI
jgi:hypothetical protein